MAEPPGPPADRSLDRRGVDVVVSALAEVVVTALGVPFPGLGSALAGGIQQGLAVGEARLARQYLESLAYAQDRLLMRLSDVELEAFLARQESAAAINQATHLAMRTPSREKHRLLGLAAMNAAVADPEDSLVPYFWTLVDKHSALEVRLLSALHDPVNRAVECGAGDYVRDAIENGKGPLWGECLFAVVPELRHPYPGGPSDADEEEEDVEYDDDEEDLFEDEDDVSGPPDPGWQLEHLVGRLVVDDLLDFKLGSNPTEPNMVAMLASDSDEILESVLRMDPVRDQPDALGRYAGLPFSATSHLGARYLAFLGDDPVWPPVQGRATTRASGHEPERSSAAAAADKD